MTRPLVEAFATAVDAYHRCRETGNEWAARHRETIERLLKDAMPSGSGIDTGTRLDLDRSTGDRLVFGASFHHMNEHGMYDGWTDHEIIVTPALIGRITLRITGRNRNEIKDYLHEVYHTALLEPAPAGRL